MKKILSPAVAAAAGSPAGDISDLTAEYRAGQVFLQWKETGLSPEAGLTVWSSPDPTGEQNYRSARKSADLLNPGSARDRWRDVSSSRIQKIETLKKERPSCIYPN